jgi:hypothetical protein
MKKTTESTLIPEDDSLPETNIVLSDSVDVQDFRRLMDKHSLNIINEFNVSKGRFGFTVLESSEALENILVATHMNWDFLE